MDLAESEAVRGSSASTSTPRHCGLLEQRVPGVRPVHTPARELPVADRSVDFVFTMGVLIHQPEETLAKVMSEMVRGREEVTCSAASTTTPRPSRCTYRGHDGALFRRDYGTLFEELLPDQLVPIRQGYLSPEEGWDRVTWWLFQRG